MILFLIYLKCYHFMLRIPACTKHIILNTTNIVMVLFLVSYFCWTIIVWLILCIVSKIDNKHHHNEYTIYSNLTFMWKILTINRNFFREIYHFNQKKHFNFDEATTITTFNKKTSFYRFKLLKSSIQCRSSFFNTRWISKEIYLVGTS